MTLAPRHQTLPIAAFGQRRAVFLTDLDHHIAYRLAAVNDRAEALGAILACRDARQLGFLDQFDDDAFARRHDRHRQRRFGQAIAGQEGAGLEARLAEGVDEALHHVGADHVGAVARHAPARQVEPVAGLRLARHAARADIVSEGGRVGEGGPGVAADHVQPRQWAAREILGLQIIGRNLVGDRRQETADQPHVVIPGQPRHAAIGRFELHAVRVRRKIVEQRVVRDRDTVREARRPAAILEVGDMIAVGLRQRRVRCGAGGEIGERQPLDTGNLRRFARHLGELVGIDQQARVATVELDAQLVDIGLRAAEAGRQRQRHRPGTGVDGAEEQRGEFRPGLGDQRDAVLGLHAHRDQAVRLFQRIGAQFGERIGAGQRAARIVEVQPARARGGIIERVAQRREIGETPRQRVFGRRGCRRSRRRPVGLCHVSRCGQVRVPGGAAGMRPLV